MFCNPQELWSVKDGGAYTSQSENEKKIQHLCVLFQVIDDMIFAIGGFNGVTTIYNVECYDPNTDEW